MTKSTSPPDASAADVAALVARVADLERAQLAEDVDAFVALFDANAVWVSAGGVRLIGRPAIAEFTAKVLPGAFVNGSVRFEVEHIRFITPDVAMTGVNQEYLTIDGQPLLPRQEGRPSYLWLRQGGQWLIASGQNTAVPAP
ncbi:SgcJ/EcaC family oxidoreductase [Ruania halotolerans]|uniref:SgcJ/EcaC family oxidoreductase n=1 Tax=Ruania halotolerans TaxID=2897773 RepID=UPI001E59A8E6|nr:SgcJ/EcaC family oxidoreductase [Ruania halotolerans]UFU05471.1 SgcJ/EcaC family oxidoreductase [Ruania halotolerans]